MHRSLASVGGAARDDLAEPLRFDEREVLQYPSEVRARIDSAAPGVRIAESSQLLEDTGPQTIEIRAELFDLASHISRRYSQSNVGHRPTFDCQNGALAAALAGRE